MSQKKDIIYQDGMFFDKQTGEFWNANKNNLQRQGKNDVFLDIKEYHLEMDFVFSKKNLNFTPLPKNSSSTTGTPSDTLKKTLTETSTTHNTPRGTIQINKSQEDNDILLIPFQFFKINSIGDRKPQYNAIGDLFSRFESINVWQNTSNLTFSLELTYCAIDPSIYNEDWVDSMVSLYKSLALPIYYDSYGFSPPPRVFVKIGNLIDNIPCIVTNIKRSSIAEGMFSNTQSTIYSENKGNYLPKYQTIQLDLTSAYSQSTDKKWISFEEVLDGNEGVSEALTIKEKPYKFGIQRGQSSSDKITRNLSTGIPTK